MMEKEVPLLTGDVSVLPWRKISNVYRCCPVRNVSWPSHLLWALWRKYILNLKTNDSARLEGNVHYDSRRLQALVFKKDLFNFDRILTKIT